MPDAPIRGRRRTLRQRAGDAFELWAISHLTSRGYFSSVDAGREVIAHVRALPRRERVRFLLMRRR